jgi:UPF0755 protein
MDILKSNRTLAERKKINKKLIVIGSLLAVVCFSLSIFAVYVQKTINVANSDNESRTKVMIVAGEGSGDIATKLSEADLLKNRFVFILYLNLVQAGDKLQAGDYEIPRNLNMIQMVEFLTTGKVTVNKVTFPEGWTLVKMGERLEANNIVTKNDFLTAAKKNYDYDFLDGKPANVDLEGFLYPDTYIFGKNDTADEVVQKMLTNFDKKLTSDIKEKADKSDLSLYEVITLASIVEREVAKPDDRKLVASVFLNRLEIGMALESCATIQYITGENKKQFTYAETRVVSPYNTYINKDLPPGPIGNPSIDSILAVLEPEESSYLYFLSADGVTYFSRTLDEHETKKAKYL